MNVRSVGLDLAGLETNETGFAYIEGRYALVRTVHKDNEILELVEYYRPDVVAVDAPLTMPIRGYERTIERKLRKMGFRVLPPLLGGMKRLTERGVRLKELLESRGFETIEVHPRTSRILLGFDEGQASLLGFLKSYGIHCERENLSVHEADSLIAAFVGVLYITGLTRNVGGDDGYIVIPGTSTS